MKHITATLVCIGKFHLFALARELMKKSMLERIFSGYPSWKLLDEDIPKAKLKTFPWLQTSYITLGKCGFWWNFTWQHAGPWKSELAL